MRIHTRVYFYPPKTQLVDPKKPKNGEYPVVNMSFKTLPSVGHIIESPNSTLPATEYRVALVYHANHGDIFLKVIPV